MKITDHEHAWNNMPSCFKLQKHLQKNKALENIYPAPPPPKKNCTYDIYLQSGIFY